MSHLRAVGEVSDPGGLASTALAEAVSYPGSSVAFAQLLSAMERSGLIEREVRGRRTYRIRPAGAVAPRARDAEPGGPVRMAEPEPDPGRAVAPGVAPWPSAAGRLDYDVLARRLLAEVLRRMTAGPGDAAPPVGAARPGDAAQVVASLEGKLASLESRHRRLLAESLRLAETLAAARESLAEQQRVASLGEHVPAGLDAGAVQLLERLMSSLRADAAREDGKKTQAG